MEFSDDDIIADFFTGITDPCDFDVIFRYRFEHRRTYSAEISIAQIIEKETNQTDKIGFVREVVTPTNIKHLCLYSKLEILVKKGENERVGKQISK